MRTKSPAIADDVKWLMENKDQLFLFVRIVRARIVKEDGNIQIKKLIGRELVKSDQFGVRLSERGRKCAEVLEAFEYLNEI